MYTFSFIRLLLSSRALIRFAFASSQSHALHSPSSDVYDSRPAEFRSLVGFSSKAVAGLALLFAFTALTAFANSYSTTFPVIENPASEGGNWVNGAKTGLLWGNVQTSPGLAFGTVISGAPPFNDSTAVLAGFWAQNQTAQATVHLANGNDSSSQEEVELHLNTSIAANNIAGYEFDASVDPNNPYLVIVRWNGPQNSFCYINSGSTCSSPRVVPLVIHDGDVLKATNVNGTLTFYVNGIAQLTATDSTYTGGAPGIGFWNVGGRTTDLSHYGFSAFSASDGQSLPTATVPSSISCSPSSLGASSSGTCTVALNQSAPTGGSVVSLSSSNSMLTVPGSVSVAAGSTSVSFTATSGNFSSNQSATVTAGCGGSTKTAAISLVATQTPPVTSSVTYVQGNNSTPQSPQSVVTASYLYSQTSGNLNVVVVGWNDSNAIVTSVSDSKGNAYTLAVGPTIQKSTATQSIYYAKNIASASAKANAVTVRFSTSARYADVRVLEYKGADLANPLDIASSTTGTSSNSNGTITTKTAGDLILAANLVQTVSSGPGNGYAQRLLTYDGDIVEDKLASSASTYTANSPIYPSAQWIMQMIAVRPASSSNTGGTLSVPASISCAGSSLTGPTSDLCTIALTTPAPTGGLGIALASNSRFASVPPSLTIAGGATSASFTATISAVTAIQTAILSASSSGVAKTAALQLNPASVFSTLSCTSSSFTGAGTDNCSVALTGPAPAGGFVVNLSSTNASVVVPAAITIPANASGAGFAASVAAVITAQPATLTATAGGVIKTLAIQLNASLAKLSVNATSVSFGNVALNQPATQSLIVTSSGTAPLSISGDSIAGTGFSASGAAFPIRLNPGQTATLNVQFDPTVTGTASGQLTLTSNASTGGTTAIALSGAGVNYQVNLSWNAPSGSSDPTVGYHVYRSLSGSNSFGLLNSSLQADTRYLDGTGNSGSSYNYCVKSVDAAGMESPASNVINVSIP